MSLVRQHSQLGLLLLGSLLVPPDAYAELDVTDYTKVRRGVVRSIDYGARTAIISGYRYSFSGTYGYDHPPVTMYGSNFGSFELLTRGMKVEVEFRHSNESRAVVKLKQLADNAFEDERSKALDYSKCTKCQEVLTSQ